MTKHPLGRQTFKQNDLFRGDRNRAQYNACVGENGGPYDLFDYALGYFEATDALLKAVTKDKGVTLDIIVYPICLNFRHAMELFIKYLISDLNKLAKSGSKYEPTHSLVENWRVAGELINKAKLGFDPKEQISMTQVVADIMEVDPNGEIFRYPESIKGDQHLKDWSLINLAVVAENVAKTKEIAERWQGKIERRFENAN